MALSSEFGLWFYFERANQFAIPILCSISLTNCASLEQTPPEESIPAGHCAGGAAGYMECSDEIKEKQPIYDQRAYLWTIPACSGWINYIFTLSSWRCYGSSHSLTQHTDRLCLEKGNDQCDWVCTWLDVSNLAYINTMCGQKDYILSYKCKNKTFHKHKNPAFNHVQHESK